MQRLMMVCAILLFTGLACSISRPAEMTAMPTPEAQTQTQSPEQTVFPTPMGSASLAAVTPGNAEVVYGPNIDHEGLRLTLDPALGTHLYAVHEVLSIGGSTAYYTRFSLSPEEPCQTWCLNVYPVAEFVQAFGSFVFPPAGYRGGAAIIFSAQEKALTFQDGSGDRGLEAAGQNHYGVSNESLRYVFRGYSSDKQFGVYLQVPLHAANLPDVAPTTTTNVDSILAYNQKAAHAMDGLSPTDFAPNLDMLDALVASIYVRAP